MFCQLFNNMPPPPPFIPKLPLIPAYPKERFDLSPFIVIGGSELVIHGPFDCRHVKCSVPIPKAEIMICWEFRFQWFDLWPENYYWLFRQAVSGSPCCCMKDVWSQTSFWDEWKMKLSDIWNDSLRSRAFLLWAVCVCSSMCWEVSCFCLRPRSAVNRHLSPEWHLHPSCEKTLDIRFCVQSMKRLFFFVMMTASVLSSCIECKCCRNTVFKGLISGCW